MHPNAAAWHPVDSLRSGHFGRRLMKGTELKTLKRITVSECRRYPDTTCSLALNWELLNHVVKDFGTKGERENSQLASQMQFMA